MYIIPLTQAVHVMLDWWRLQTGISRPPHFKGVLNFCSRCLPIPKVQRRMGGKAQHKTKPYCWGRFGWEGKASLYSWQTEKPPSLGSSDFRGRSKQAWSHAFHNGAHPGHCFCACNADILGFCSVSHGTYREKRIHWIDVSMKFCFNINFHKISSRVAMLLACSINNYFS